MLKLPASTASMVNELQTEIDCFCKITKNSFLLPEWSLTEDAKSALKFLLSLNCISVDMTLNKLATIISNSDYVFSDMELG